MSNDFEDLKDIFVNSIIVAVMILGFFGALCVAEYFIDKSRHECESKKDMFYFKGKCINSKTGAING